MSDQPEANDATARVWRAVHLLTEPQRRQIGRHREAGDWIEELAAVAYGVCSVPAYRAATVTWATIPSLWDQATNALVGGEQGGTGSKPKRERSPADLDLMEIRALIRDTTRHELRVRGLKTAKDADGFDVPFTAAEIRRLASLVIEKDGADNLWWWEYRFAQWGRLLEAYLHAAEHQPKSVRLRNSACPLCRTSQVIVDVDGERQVLPAIVIDFRDGYVRAAVCEACGHTLAWRGDLDALAKELDATRPTAGVVVDISRETA